MKDILLEDDIITEAKCSLDEDTLFGEDTEVKPFLKVKCIGLTVSGSEGALMARTLFYLEIGTKMLLIIDFLTILNQTSFLSKTKVLKEK